MSLEMEERAKAELDSDPRVDLAVERTELALERTHLAWIRTMFAIMTTGIAIDKGVELIHEQKVLKNESLVQNGHIIGICITSFGILVLLAETVQFYRRSRQLAAMKKSHANIFSTNLILSILVIITGIALVYLMVTTG